MDDVIFIFLLFVVPVGGLFVVPWVMEAAKYNYDNAVCYFYPPESGACHK